MSRKTFLPEEGFCDLPQLNHLLDWLSLLSVLHSSKGAHLLKIARTWLFPWCNNDAISTMHCHDCIQATEQQIENTVLSAVHIRLILNKRSKQDEQNWLQASGHCRCSQSLTWRQLKVVVGWWSMWGEAVSLTAGQQNSFCFYFVWGMLAFCTLDKVAPHCVSDTHNHNHSSGPGCNTMKRTKERLY